MSRLRLVVVPALVALVGGTVVVPAAPPATAEPLNYVALGDSFTSTGSVIGMDPGTFGSSGSLGQYSCFRSSDGYPAQLAAQTGWHLTDVSCRGGRVPYIYEWTPAYGAPQIDAVHPGVDVVTLQVGGNDTDVLHLASRCLLTADCRGFEDEWAATIPEVRPGLEQLIRDIRHRAPRARVVLVGYLQPFPVVPCFDIAPYSAANQALARRHVERLNAMLRQAAVDTGVEIVADTTPSGHSACDPDRWTSFLGIDAGAVPLHPTRAGHAAVAAMLREKLGA